MNHKIRCYTTAVVIGYKGNWKSRAIKKNKLIFPIHQIERNEFNSYIYQLTGRNAAAHALIPILGYRPINKRRRLTHLSHPANYHVLTQPTLQT
jgi:hypothetical protein